jgi:uncharacterized Zn-binding protein involved in type VI secretion
MPLVARHGTEILHEDDEVGTVTVNQIGPSTVKAEGALVARNGDGCSIHGGNKVVSVSTVLVVGAMCAHVGDATTCEPPGVLQATGSATTVFADDGG